MNVSDFLQKNNIHIFYLCNDAERALGLNFLTNNFHIVCIDETELYKKLDDEFPNIHFCLESKTKKYNSTFRSSAELLHSSEVMNFIDSFQGEKYIQVFKTSPQIENRCKNLNLKLLNNSAKLSQYFEDKFNLAEILANSTLTKYLPTTYLDDISQVEYKDPIVIQLNRGHTGDGTWIIKSQDDLAKVKEKLFHAEVKVTEFLEGIPVNVNGIVTKNGIFVAGLNRQIQDKTSKIAPHLGVTLGNSYYLNFINDGIKSEIINLTQKLGKFMNSKGYKGFFGIDLMILPSRKVSNDSETKGSIKIIEINARQTANVSFFNELQFKNELSPILSELNLATFLDIEIDTELEKYNQINFKNFQAGQIIIRNYLGKIINYNDLKLNDNFAKFTIQRRNQNHQIKQEQEIFRMQSFEKDPLDELGEIKNDLFEYIEKKLKIKN